MQILWFEVGTLHALADYMKNRLRLYIESETKLDRKPKNAACRNLRQFKLITLYRALSQEMDDTGAPVKDHYENLLVSLKRLIESYGPSADYEQWVNSIHYPAQLQRRGR